MTACLASTRMGSCVAMAEIFHPFGLRVNNAGSTTVCSVRDDLPIHSGSRRTSSLSSSQALAGNPLPSSLPFVRTRHVSSEGVRHSTVRAIGPGVNWDPEGLLGRPEQGLISRRRYQKQKDELEAERNMTDQQRHQMAERRRLKREARLVPEADTALVDFFLDTEVQEMENEIARCRPRLTPAFFALLGREMGTIRFALQPTEAQKERLDELEALRKVLEEGIEAYDKMEGDLVGAKAGLARILSSKDKKATLLEMAAANELNRPLLQLLDQNIAAAIEANEEKAAEFMQKVRGAVVKYITI